jgi:hypothetical protein
MCNLIDTPVEQLDKEAHRKALGIKIKVFALFRWPLRSANFLVRRFVISSRVDDSYWNSPFWCAALVSVFVLWACLLSVVVLDFALTLKVT